MNRIAKIVIRHWKLLVAWNVLVLGITAFNIKTTPRIWNSQAQLILPNVTNNSDADLGKLGSVRDEGVVFSQQLNPLNILSSIAISDHVIKEVWEKDPEKDQFSRLSNFKKLFKVSPEKESTVISLNVESSSPELAAQRATALITAFRNRLQELRLDEAQQRSQFMQNEVKQALQKLLVAQKALSEFRESSNLVNSDEQTKEIIAAMNTLSTEQAQAIAEAQAAQARVRMLSSRVALSPAAAVSSVRLKELKEYQLIRDKLSEVEVALVEARGKLTSNHPQVQDLQYQQNVLSNRLQQYVSDSTGNVAGVDNAIGENTAGLAEQMILAESQAMGMQEKAQQLQPAIDKLAAKLNSLPQKQGKLLELQRQYDIAEGVYNGVVAQAEQAKLGAFSAYPSVQVLDQPAIDTKATGPKLRLMILGALLASGFGSAAIALFWENRNPLLSPKDIQQTNIPVLASVPYIKNIGGKLEQIGGEIEFQRLASAVSLMQLDSGRLMIASATTGEGKTTTILGLGNALISLGFKVLVVDGDFRKAELSESLGYQPQKNWDSRFTQNEIRPNLDLLSVSIAEDKISEFVARGEFEQYLNYVQVNGKYDYVLVDSSPVTLTPEAALLAKVISKVLFVVRSTSSHRNCFYDSIEQLTRHKAEIAGLVVNGVETRAQGYMYGQNIVQVQ
ncbi:MAG: exopolysaccharide biosynthesis protein [Richelia sp. RM2_1_2]|nr:exopolysaccharide biosynthesis protein [Richelia sp. SM1_7_0]NJN11850.1 exopolysaccharide biosynthesis protein [Richelia sp. RM1_1_1]NJO29775.1 exopolysaccharide biosynthesis protein [Richelia sp. SL_2_1]NJO58180.1 exopolysaccharide biosynthesis protein [Richelia sp. RM2_1_2]